MGTLAAVLKPPAGRLFEVLSTNDRAWTECTYIIPFLNPSPLQATVYALPHVGLLQILGKPSHKRTIVAVVGVVRGSGTYSAVGVSTCIDMTCCAEAIEAESFAKEH